MSEPVDTARILAQLKAGAPAILAQYPVRLAYVYGSVARGQATPLSDVDVGVLFDEDVASYDRLLAVLDLEWRFKEITDTVLEFQVGDMNDRPILLLGEIVRDGVPIYARDEQDRLTYESAIHERYAIERPRLETYYRAYLRSVLEELRG